MLLLLVMLLVLRVLLDWRNVAASLYAWMCTPTIRGGGGRRRRASVANESTVTCMTRHVKVAGRLGSKKYRFMIVSDNSEKRF